MITTAITIAAPYAAQLAPKALPIARFVGLTLASSAVVNEGRRALVNRRNRAIEKKERAGTVELERFEAPPKPLWKRLTWTRSSETFSEGAKRHGKVAWDIACYALGDQLYWLNFATVKLVKGALFVTAAVVQAVTYPLIAVGLAFGLVGGMDGQRYLDLLNRAGDWTNKVYYAPFAAVRWVDNFVEDKAWALMIARSVLALPRKQEIEKGEESNVVQLPVAEETKAEEPTVTEVTVDEVKVAETKPAEEADIHHLVVLLTIDSTKAKRNPRSYGAELYAQSGKEGGDTLRKALPQQLRDAGLTGRDVTLILQGYDKAASTATPTA